MTNKKLLIFNGSPRKKGTSYSFALTIKKLAEEVGNTAEIIHIIEYLEEGKNIEDLRESIVNSQIIAISSPLYVDSLPHPVIWFFEELVNKYKTELKEKSFFAIGLCAFPYPVLIDTLIDCCRCFAEEAQMKWLGKKGVKITSAFKHALKEIYEGKEMSSMSQKMLSKEIPRLLVRPMALLLNHMAKTNGKKNGFTVADIERKAYLE